MADSVRTKLREAIAYDLSQITISNGYLVDMGDVNKEPKSVEQFVNFNDLQPACNINFGREDYLNALPGSHTVGYLQKSVFVNLQFYIKNVNALREEQSKILASVEKYFMNNPWIPDSGGNATAQETQVMSNMAWGLEATKDYGGIGIPLRVDYRQNLFNPELTTYGTPPSLPQSFPITISVSVREELRNALLYQIREITTANGYNFNAKTNENILSAEQITEYPFVNINVYNETYMNATDLGWQDKRLHKLLSLEMDVWLNSVNSIEEDRDKVVADIEKRLLNNFNLPNSDNKRTCFTSILTFNDPFGIESSQPYGGITVGYDIFYRQDQFNPANPYGAT